MRICSRFSGRQAQQTALTDRQHLTIHCAVSRVFLLYVSSVLSWWEEENVVFFIVDSLSICLG